MSGISDGARRGRSAPRRIGWLDGDVVFVFAALVTSLFILLLPKIGPGLLVALPLLHAAYHPNRITRVVYRCSPMLILPLFCMASSLWSPFPGISIYSSTLFLITAVIGLILGNGIPEKSLLRGLFLGFGLYAVACFLVGVKTGFFWNGNLRQVPFVAFAGSKNVTGDVAAIATMVDVTMLFLSLRERQPLWALASLALIAIELLIVVAALSTGAIVSMLVGLSVIVLLTLARALPVQARSLAFGTGLLLAAVAAFTQNIWMNSLLARIMKAGGKDTTFTGRAYIWSRAEVMIQQHPALGTGFGGFWVAGNLEAEAIWKRLYITNKFGFNFHNTRLDILVHLGYVGLGLFILVFAIYGAVLLVRTIQKPGPIGIFFVAMFAYEATRMGFESIGYGIFHHATILLFAALAWAVRQPETKAAPAISQAERSPVRRTRPLGHALTQRRR